MKEKPAYIERGCTGGDPFGCETLGHQYDNGEGVPQDASKARQLLDKACKGGVLAGRKK